MSMRRLTDAQRALTEQNLGLVRAVIHRAGFEKQLGWDDAFQIGAIGLMRAAATFNPEKGRFSTYATPCIHREILQYIRRRKSVSRGSGQMEVSLDAPIDTLDGLTLHDVLFDNGPSVEETCHIRSVLAVLGRPEFRDVWKHHVKGLKQVEIAAETGVSRACVNKRVKRQIEKLRSGAY